MYSTVGSEKSCFGLLRAASLSSMAWIMGVSSAQGQSLTYTLDADFNLGTLINLSQVPADQLQLVV